MLHEAVLSGFEQYKHKYGERTKPPKFQYVKDFRPHWNNLSTEGALVVWKNRIFVPEACRCQLLKELHKGHQGITRTLQNARQSIYWHGITKDVELMCNRCEKCQKLKPSLQKETLISDELPERPFDVVSADLFYVGKKVYMIFADRLSGYPLVNVWTKDPTTTQVVKQLQRYFSLFGKPLKFKSDGGAQFDSKEMREFSDEYCIQHGQSSPYYPESNGHAERNVGILKQLIIKTDNDITGKGFLDGISQLRNTPREDGFSPTQVVIGRSIPTLLPTLTEALGTNEFVEKAKKKKEMLDFRRKSKFDQTSKNLKPLNPGTTIWVQNSETKRWEDKAKVIAKVRNRTYKIMLQDGKISYRNRRKIKARDEVLANSSYTEETPKF